MWPLQPGYFGFHLAMKLGMIAEARADLLGAGLEQDRAVGLLERLAERDRRPRRRPGPVSVCRPSIGTPKASISSISAFMNSRLWFMRSSE